MSTYNILIGNQLKKLRELRNLSLRQLSDSCGVSPAAIYNYESGKRTIDLDRLKAICESLDYDMIRFLSDVKKINEKI